MSGNWYINKITAKTSPIKGPIFIKKSQEKEDDIKILRNKTKIGMNVNSKSIGIIFSGLIPKFEMRG